MTDHRVFSSRRRVRAIRAAVVRLQEDLLRLFPGAEGKSRNEGDPIPEMLIGLGQCEVSADQFLGSSDSAIHEMFERNG